MFHASSRKPDDHAPTMQRNGRDPNHREHGTTSAGARVQDRYKTSTKTPPAEARGVKVTLSFRSVWTHDAAELSPGSPRCTRPPMHEALVRDRYRSSPLLPDRSFGTLGG